MRIDGSMIVPTGAWEYDYLWAGQGAAGRGAVRVSKNHEYLSHSPTHTGYKMVLEVTMAGRKRNEDGYMEDWAIKHVQHDHGTKEGTPTPIPADVDPMESEKAIYHPPKGVRNPLGKHRHGLPYSI